MNPKKVLKRIFGVALLLLIIAFFTIGTPVFAVEGEGGGDNTGSNDGFNETAELIGSDTNCKDNPKPCDKQNKVKPTSPTVVERYGLKLKYVSGNKYKVTMSENCNEGVKFILTKINEDDGSKKTSNPAIKKDVLDCENPITFEISKDEVSNDNAFGLDGIDITLTSTCNVMDAPKSPKTSCYWNFVEAGLFTTVGGSELHSSAGYDIGTISTGTYNTVSIDCDNNKVTVNGETTAIKTGSFEDKFCYAKKHASKTFTATDSNNRNNTELITFKCESDIEKLPTNPDELEGDAYFTNKTYLYGKTTFSEEETLVFHYAPDYVDKSKKISCEVTCEEAVDVEYGPPVATAAGMCFDYKVRVTSRVSCNMTKAPSQAGLCETSVCTPTPQCVHSGGTIYTQAGPNEDYNSCINKCDGGLYTKKCTTECYKKIYGGVSAYAKTKSVYYDEAFGVQLSHTWGQRGSEYTCNGYYNRTKDTNSAINWISTDSTASAGRYYCGDWRYRELSYRITFYADENGFFRKDFGGGELCNASCYWDGCRGKEYLNVEIPCKIPGKFDASSSSLCVNGKINIAKYDCEQNKKKYEDLVDACQKMTSCTTTTAEFTMQAEYTKLGSAEVTKIDFPYGGKDIVTPGTTVEEKVGSTLLPNYPGKDEGFLGCYTRDGNPSVYRATWGFPGSWRNLKTGEVSYDPSIGGNTDTDPFDSIWLLANHKFCIPGDAKSVNSKWWNAFKHRTTQNIVDIETTTVTDEKRNECLNSETEHTIVTETQTKFDEKDLVWNIHAKTKNFGYFGWDVQLDCFFATNNRPTVSTNTNETSSNVETPITCDTESYRVRSTDAGDLFPNENGEKLLDPATSGREPGYNWSEYAVNNKNPNYVSNPPKYMEALQRAAIDAKGSGKEIYSDNNLDYQFYLSPEVLRQIRKDRVGNTTSKNYTSFSDSGFTVDANGNGRYKSAWIRSLGDASDRKIPGDTALICNNMINWQSAGCSDVHTTGKFDGE